jgi:hypothetical protein
MESDEILQLLRRRPFQPFRIYLTTGATFEFRHPEMIFVYHTYVKTYLPVLDKNESVPLGDKEVILSLLHIVQIEFLGMASKR